MYPVTELYKYDKQIKDVYDQKIKMFLNQNI